MIVDETAGMLKTPDAWLRSTGERSIPAGDPWSLTTMPLARGISRVPSAGVAAGVWVRPVAAVKNGRRLGGGGRGR